MRFFLLFLLAGAIFGGPLFVSLCAEEKGRVAPAPPPATVGPAAEVAAPSTAASPSALGAAGTEAVPVPGTSPSPAPARAAQSQAVPTPSSTAGAVQIPAVQCDCSGPKDGSKWTGKDWAALLGSLAGALVAVIAIISNAVMNRRTTAQKANETELESLQSKLDNFYGPYQQLSNTNRLIATDLKKRHAAGSEMRILLLLLDPKWEEQFSPGEVALVREILSIDERLLDLIQEKSGLVSDEVQPYLWRAASHFRIMKLASEGKLDNDPERYTHYVYPKQLDQIIQMEIDRLHGRMNLIRGEPMVLHPPASKLNIPEGLRLADWLASPGDFQRLD